MATEKEIEEVKNRINIYDIVSGYIKLKQSGNNFFGLCPFHNEKSPSFSVNNELGIFKCFGCQESGDVIAFLEKIENISFREAIELLADRAGVKLSHAFKQEKSEKKRILEMNALAQELFVYLLTKHAIGKNAREYIRQRNLTTESIKEFGLGYDHGNTAVRVLRKRGFADHEIISFGIGVVRNGQLVDKYRNRLVFPIFSIAGDIIGFSGRIIEKNDRIPKYINSPETEVFKKNMLLYGLYNSKKYIKEMDNTILLEGPIDVISAFQNGVKNVCAAQGTSLTQNHLQLLKRFSQNITFCFDQDNAGMKALRRSFFLAAEAEMDVKVIKINNAKDIDERVNADKKGFQEDMSKPLDLIEYMINKSINEENISVLDGKIKVINSILPLITIIKDNIKKSFYIGKLAEAVQVDDNEIRKMMTVRNEEYKKTVVKNIEKTIKDENSRLDYLLALFLQNYKDIHDTIMKFDVSLIYDLNIKAIIFRMKETAEKGGDVKSFIASLDEKDKEKCINLMTINLRKLKTDDTETILHEIISITKILKRKKAIKDINELKNRLWVYEQEKDEDNVHEIMEHIAKLTGELEN